MLPRITILAVLGILPLLVGCKVDAITTVNLSDINNAVTAREPVDLTTRLLLTFTSSTWCENMGASLVVSLNDAGLNMTPVACAQDPDGNAWRGELRMPIRLVSILSGRADETRLASLQAKPSSENPNILSLVAHLDVPRLNDARERLLRLPVARDSEEARVFDLTVTIMLRNDLAKTAVVQVDAMTSEAGALIEIPAGGVRTFSLSKQGLESLYREQSAEVLRVN